MTIIAKFFISISRSERARLLVASLIAVFCSFLFLLLGKQTVGTLIGVNENFYLKYFYDIVNSGNLGDDAIPESLTIIDVRNYSNRRDLAYILEKVYSFSPQIIGLDVHFKNNPDIKSSTNDSLISVFQKVWKKTVVACSYKSERGRVCIDYPFFKGCKGLENVIYTSSLVQGFYGKYLIKDTINNLPRFSYEIAKRSKIELQNDLEGMHVNYSKKNLDAITLDDTLDIRESNIKDKIVLIGNMAELKDLTRLPFKFGGKKDISGIEDHAYSLISLLNFDRENSKSYSRRFEGLRDISPFANLLFVVLFTLIYCIICSFVNKRIRNSVEKARLVPNVKNKLVSCICVLSQPIIFVAYEIFIVLLCFFIITFMASIIPDLFLAMVSIALVSVSLEVTNIILYAK